MKKTSRRTGGSRKRSTGRPAPVAEVLAALSRVAARRRLRWYLFGAQAVALYGVERTSADVDVTVELPAKQSAAFARDMARAGFELRVADADEFVARTRVLPFEHRATRWPLDVVLAGPGLEEAFLAAARPIDVAGTLVPVLAPEDLIATKILAGRPKDLEDVRGILAQPSLAIDLVQLRATLRSIEDALDQRDLRPVLERILAAVRR